jgi:fused signal recognition particle receptor
MFKRGLFKNIFQRVDQLFTGRGRIDEELFEELEEALIASDLNVHTTMRLMEELRSAVRDERLKEPREVMDRLKAFILGVLTDGEEPRPRPVPVVPAPVPEPEPVVAVVETTEFEAPVEEAEAAQPATMASRFMSWFKRAPSGQPIAEAPLAPTPVAPAAAPAPIAEPVAEVFAGVSQALNVSPASPSVYLIVGVNGVGKTTSIAKVAYSLKQEGKRVVLGAADTFRAAAVDQLAMWGDRLGVEVIKGREGQDPASVVFDSVQAGLARKADYVIIDTAGRLHNKSNLMEELKKINRVVMRARDGRPADETLLVLDATTGQNAVSQAKEFKTAVDVSGLILAKLDGTARGGIVITIKDELGIPIKLIGTGEKPGDIEPFNAEEFVDALFD